MEIGLFVNLSTTTNTASYPCLSFGNVRKSIEICCQGRSGTGRGFRSPGGKSFGACATIPDIATHVSIHAWPVISGFQYFCSLKSSWVGSRCLFMCFVGQLDLQFVIVRDH